MEIDKPVIVHSRKAELECIEVLEKLKAKKVIMHCFCGKFSLAARIAKNGWFLSIPANVNYTDQFQNIAEKIDIKNLLCETDAPYFHPLKEKNNEPSNVVYSYKKISELKKISLEKIEEKIEENFKKLFLVK